MSKVANPDLFRAIYQAAFRAIESGKEPNRNLKGGERIYRASDKIYVLEDQKLTLPSLETCLIVRDGSSDDKNPNRFTGRAPDGSANVGGVYFSMSLPPMMMEMRHYNAKRNVFNALRGKVVLELEVRGAITVEECRPLAWGT